MDRFSCEFQLELILLYSHSIGNFTVPFLSWVAVSILILMCVMGIRAFLILQLVNEFTKVLRGANKRRNLEPLNILGRAPDYDDMIYYIND